MIPRKAKAIEVLLGQVNATWPNRSTAADGWIGDEAHRLRKSDHNANAAGAVCAYDFTNDPIHGLSSEQLAEGLRRTKDPRLHYLISNRKIASAPSFAWEPYHGKNAHDHHCHVSVFQTASLYDAVMPWVIDGRQVIPTPAAKLVPPKLMVGTSGLDVALLQQLLNKKGAKLLIDQDFGKNTLKAVKAFQAASGLDADGVVGPYTWDALKKGV